MAVVKAVQGGRWPPQPLVWEIGGQPVNLSGASLTGSMLNRGTGTTRAISGQLTLVDAVRGEFVWYYAPEDVAEAGEFDVEFVAEFTEGEPPVTLRGKTFLSRWSIDQSPSGGD